MEKIAKRLTDWLIAKEAVAFDEKELYEYGIFHLLLNIIDTISILLLAVLFHEVMPTVFYIICFCTLRKYAGGYHTLRRYAGGYHAKTVFTCYLLTLTAALGMLVLLKQFDFIAPVQFAIWFISGMIILLFSPIQNVNKILDDIEKVIYQKRTIITWLIQTIGMVLLYWLDFSNCFEAILISHVYVAISMIVEKSKLITSAIKFR